MENKKALYRLYRPINFDQVAGHDGVKEILISQIRSNNFPHALLFSGQRGTGKTSVAKIFAKVVNCQNLIDYNPCENCLSCLEFNKNSHADIFEMDAASNNGVDEIRNLKTNTTTLPTFSKYKVYIIDEVHMLTNSAFNALLKTLEEPPKHVLFVLATTELSKIPATIISRCQLFNFKSIKKEALKNKIKEICFNEKKQITEETLDEIFYMSEGSLRDALNYLEQAMTISGEVISVEELKKIFYISTKKEKLDLIKAILNNENTVIIKYFNSANEAGVDFQTLVLGLIDLLKEVIEYKLTNNLGVLKILSIEEIETLKYINKETLFEIVESLINAFSKSKNSSISFQYILISVLRIATNINPQETNKYSSSNETKTIEVKEDTFSNLDKQEMNIIFNNDLISGENNVNHNLNNVVSTLKPDEDSYADIKHIENHENIDDESSLNDSEFVYSEENLLKAQMKLLLEEPRTSDVIDFSDDLIISILIGADKNTRTKLSDLLYSVFDEKMGWSYTQKFICFYNTKLSAANDKGLIILCEDRSIARLINNKLQKKDFRKMIFDLFQLETKILAVEKTRWKHIKNEYLFRKQNGVFNVNVPNQSVEEFYEQVVKTKDDINNENEFYSKAKEILGVDNIKVVD